MFKIMYAFMLANRRNFRNRSVDISYASTTSDFTDCRIEHGFRVSLITRTATGHVIYLRSNSLAESAYHCDDPDIHP